MIVPPLDALVEPVSPLSASLTEAFASVAAVQLRNLMPGASMIAALHAAPVRSALSEIRALQATSGVSRMQLDAFSAAKGIAAALGQADRRLLHSVMDARAGSALASALSPTIRSQIAGFSSLNLGSQFSSLVAGSQFASLRSAIPSVPSVFLALPRLDWFRDLVAHSLSNWQESVKSGLDAARSWGRRALRAALAARQAFVQHGRLDLAEAFVREWLGVKYPLPVHVEAAVDALLEPGWEPAHEDIGWQDGADLVADLKGRFARATRARRWIGDTQINGRSVAYLDQPLGLDSDDGGLTLLDTLKVLPTDPPDWGFNDARLNRVVPLLTTDEREVCLVRGGGGVTWEEAALDVGLAPESGESVRRRRERLVKEMSRRETARRTTSAGGR